MPLCFHGTSLDRGSILEILPWYFLLPILISLEYVKGKVSMAVGPVVWILGIFLWPLQGCRSLRLVGVLTFGCGLGSLGEGLAVRR